MRSPTLAILSLSTVFLSGCEQTTQVMVKQGAEAAFAVPVAAIPNVPIDLGVGEGYAIGINQAGQVVGRTADGGGFVWDEGMVTPLPLSPIYEGLSDLGHVVGTDEVYWQGVIHPLPGLGGAWVRATAVNSSGEVIGQSETASGTEGAFIWQQGVTTDLGSFGGSRTVATAINEVGDVVGFSEAPDGSTRAFLWTSGTLTDLGLGDDSEAHAVSDGGKIAALVGRFPRDLVVIDGDNRKFAGRASALPTHLASYPVATPSMRVNDLGQVIFWGAGCSAQFPVYWDGSAFSGQFVTPCGFSPDLRCCLTLSEGGRISWFSFTGDEGDWRSYLTRVGDLLPEGETMFYDFPPNLMDLRGEEDAIAFTRNEVGHFVGAARAATGLRHATLWRALAVEESVSGIQAEVAELLDGGALAAGQAAGLTAKLQAATAMLNDGKSEAAIRILEAFIAQVGAAVQSGQIEPSDGARLTEQAQAAIAAIGP